MSVLHENLASGTWYRMSISEQLGNIGSEVGRALKWKTKGYNVQTQNALDRALDLFDLTLDDPRWKKYQGRLKEIARARENTADFFYGQNQHQSSPEKLEKYFYYFAFADRKNK